jgi:hypothetical protein
MIRRLKRERSSLNLLIKRSLREGERGRGREREK